jgi:hypothetical protein
MGSRRGTGEMTSLQNMLTAAQLVVFVVGACIAYFELHNQYKLRRLQTLYSLNERLAKYNLANEWISDPDNSWSRLGAEVRSCYQSYVATFEDIGLARQARVITRQDFISSYGGRYRNLIRSDTLQKYMEAANYDAEHFAALEILNDDIAWTEKQRSTTNGRKGGAFNLALHRWVALRQLLPFRYRTSRQ